MLEKNIAGSIAMAIAVASCAHLGATSPLPPATGEDRGLKTLSSTVLAGHLYVADAVGVQRFPIVNGVPAARADLTYTGVAAPIALDNSNHLYATSGLTVVVYAPGTTTRIRTLRVSTPPYFGATILGGVRALTVDAAGHLYAALSIRAPSCPVCILYAGAKAVMIYAANASGTPKPVQWFFAYFCAGCTLQAEFDQGGLALYNGNLLVATLVGGAKVITISNPISSPGRLHTLSGTGVQLPRGLAIDSLGELYVNNSNSTSSFVAVYPATASGSPAPSREISVFGQKSFGTGIATRAGRLFIPDSAGNIVFDVSSTIGGRQTAKTLAVSDPIDVKLGP